MNTKHFLFASLILFACACVGVWQINMQKNQPKSSKSRADGVLLLPTPDLILSLPTGFYARPHADTLRIGTVPPPHAQVYYTTDGSTPTRRSTRYTEPLHLSKIMRNQWLQPRISYLPTSPIYKLPTHTPFYGVCVRMAAFTKKNGFGSTTTATYFIYNNEDNEDKNTKNAPPYPYAKVLINTDAKHFFDAQKGIYILGEKYFNNDNLTQERMDLPEWLYYKLPANYMERGKKWRKPANITYLDAKNCVIFCHDAQISIKGNASRALPQKSIKIKFRNDIIINKNIFDNIPNQQYTELLLRNGSGDFTHTMLRDEFVQTLLKNTTLLTQAYQPVVVFVNGAYWGLHNLREEITEKNLALKLNTTPENIQLAEIKDKEFCSNNPRTVDTLRTYQKFWLDSKLSNQKFYDLINVHFDINNLIEYCIIEAYCGNTDWLNNNVKLYKNGNNKWQFIIYDTDFAFGGSGEPQAYTKNMYDFIEKSDCFFAKVIIKLMQNDDFKQKYQAKYAIMQKNTLDKNAMLRNFDMMAQRIAPLMPEHTARWGYPMDWAGELEIVRQFIRVRGQYDPAQLQNFIAKSNPQPRR